VPFPNKCSTAILLSKAAFLAKGLMKTRWPGARVTVTASSSSSAPPASSSTAPNLKSLKLATSASFSTKMATS